MIPTQSLTSPADWPDLAWNDTLPGPRELVLFNECAKRERLTPWQ
jgi:hypothetical protein